VNSLQKASHVFNDVANACTNPRGGAWGAGLPGNSRSTALPNLRSRGEVSPGIAGMEWGTLGNT